MSTRARDAAERRCAEAIEALSLRQWARWSGLPAALTLHQLLSGCAGRRLRGGFGRLGERERAMQHALIAVPLLRSPLRAWVGADGVVELLDIEHPYEDNALDALADALGAPQARLPAYWDSLRLARSEWVYPERGLALFTYPDAGIVLRLAAFVPTTIEHYREALRLDLEAVPSPVPGIVSSEGENTP